jgi:flavin-binding protein dodecin
MNDHVYKVVELVGSSAVGTDDAVRNAIARASETLRRITWFEVVETRGHVEDGAVGHFQVTLKVGFTLEDAGTQEQAAAAAQAAVNAAANEPALE